MSLQSIRQKTVKNIFLSFLILTLNGCVYMVVGGLGAVGGYVVSPDTVEGLITGHDSEEVWEAVVEVVSILGVIQERDDKGGVMIAKISGATVTVTVLRMSSSAVKLSVKSRKLWMPRIKTSQETYIKIVNYLKG
jgi:hypothetical protein